MKDPGLTSGVFRFECLSQSIFIDKFIIAFNSLSCQLLFFSSKHTGDGSFCVPAHRGRLMRLQQAKCQMTQMGRAR